MKDKHYAAWVEALPSLEGKNVAITGTTSGTGYWTAVCAIRKKAKTLILLNRESKRSVESKKKLVAEKEAAKSPTQIEAIACDLQSFESIKAAAGKVNELVKSLGGLNVLVNNAGVMAFPDVRTGDGYEVQMQTNHLSHFLLTKLLLPSLKMVVDAGGEVRVAQHSSLARKSPETMLEAKYFEKTKKQTLGGDSLGAKFARYHQTKLANTCFAMGLHTRLAQNGYDVNKFKSVVAEPGYSETSLLTSTIQETNCFMKPVYWLMAQFSLSGMQSAADGALPLIEASFGKNVDSGDFFHPENKRNGKPFKAISNGKLSADAKSKEKLTLDVKNHDLLWAKSEEACGSFF